MPTFALMPRQVLSLNSGARVPPTLHRSSSRLDPHRYQSPSPKSAIFNIARIPTVLVSAETPPPLRTSAAGQFARPLFSWSYKLLFPQPVSFDNHLRCPGGGGPSPQNCSCGVESCPCPRSYAPTIRRTSPRSTNSTRPASLPASPTRKPLCGTSSLSAPPT